jgi:hypothetical protein
VHAQEAAAQAARSDLLPVRHAFGVGEYFKFSLQYGPIKAGTATLSVEAVEDVNGLPCYRLASTARSNAMFSAFYKVRDRVESFVDVGELLTRRSTKKLREKDYRREERLDWDQVGGKITYGDGRLVDIEANTRDILGALYYVRTFELQVGDRIPLHTHDNEKSYDLWIEVLREETIDTPVGTFDCLVVEPHMETDGLFKRSGSLLVWLTQDDSHMPVMMQSKIKVGAVSAILVDIRRGSQAVLDEPSAFAN